MVGLCTRKKVSLPWLHTLHTVELFKTIKKDRVRIEIEEEIVRNCDMVVSPTEREAFALRERYRNIRVLVIPHGVDIQQFRPSSNGHARLLFVGRIDPIKGLDVLIDALRSIKRDIHLDIVGGPSKDKGNMERVREYAEDLPVDFHGAVKHEELASYYRNASILVVPSYYESFGLVALEAMASARPVIGFEDTGLSETVGRDAGILVERNEKNLGGAISHLINRQDICFELGMNGRRKAERFSWKMIARKYWRTYGAISKD